MLSRAANNFLSASHSHQQRSATSGPQSTSKSSSNAGGNMPPGVLKASTQTTLNQSQENGLTASSNPLKRSASQVDFAGASRFPQKITAMSTQAGVKTGSSVINRIHNSVFFDENDFADEVDLDYDDKSPDPVRYPSLGPRSLQADRQHGLPGSSNLSVEYPQLPEQSFPPNNQSSIKKAACSSGVPIEWSSSPPSHKAPPPNASLLHRPTDIGEALGENLSSIKSDAPVRPTKRRTYLPWQGEKESETKQTLQSDGRKPQGQSQGLSQKVKKELGEPYTPLPKNTTGASHPWNKTASAIKEEQRRYRLKANQGKKVIKQVQEDGKPVVSKTKSREKKVARVFLSDEQKRVLDLVVDGNRSVFFTGSAGTGKSVLMREIITVLRKKYQREPDRVAVTASTGLAACNIGGVTLHSFAGIGLGKERAEDLVKKIKKNSKAKNRWMRTKVLIVDEISMVDGTLFDKLEYIARDIRRNGRPFGGIQLVVTGDFFQLPPVPDFGREATFAFDAATWATSVQHTIGLTQVFRQKDPTFASMLNEMRVGRLSRESIDAFFSLHRKLDVVDDVEATELFPTRNEVENANNMRMQQLGGGSQTFQAHDSGSITDTTQREKLLSNCMAPQSITLKKGAQVMLIKNLDDSLVNGSIGKVIAFMDERTYDHYVEDEDHFQPLDSSGVEPESFAATREKLKSMVGKENPANTSQVWPLVRFPLADGTFRDLLCVREAWKIELPSGEIQAQRSQVPLILAWALSIHKAQGQTLERVKVDLGKIFEKGQAYVALSRATSQEGLQILRFDPRKVMAHDRVRHFYDSLYSAHVASSSSGRASGPSRSATSESRADEDLAMDHLADEQARAEASI